MNVNLLESTILKSKNNPTRLTVIAKFLEEQKIRASYFITRFLDDFSEYQERGSSVHQKFFEDKSADYVQATRLLRIIDAYNTRTN